MTPAIRRIDDRLLNPREAANILGVSRWTLKRLADGPPCIQISPRRSGYRLSDIRSWLDRRAHGEAGTA